MTESIRGSHATALMTALEQPVHNRTIDKDVGRGDLDYEVYLRTRELLALQTRPAELTVLDEHVFQTTHQTQELWLKSAAFEVVALVDALDGGRLHEACASLDRIVAIQDCLAHDIRVLYTLAPDTFLTIRRNLGNGSGLESPGYNRLLLAAEAAEAALDRALEREGVALLAIYAPPADAQAAEQHAGLRRVVERALDWDSAFQAWLVAHFFLVRRTLGVHRTVRALDGFPTQALPARMTKPLFAKLWDARVELTASWQREGGHAPGASRSASGGPAAGGSTAANAANVTSAANGSSAGGGTVKTPAPSSARRIEGSRPPAPPLEER